MVCNQYDIVHVDFPFVETGLVNITCPECENIFTEPLQSKMRYALVLSNFMYNRNNDTTVLAMISSQVIKAHKTDIVIQSLASTGLPKNSLIRFQIASIRNFLIKRPLGKLDLVDRTAVERALNAWR